MVDLIPFWGLLSAPKVEHLNDGDPFYTTPAPLLHHAVSVRVEERADSPRRDGRRKRRSPSPPMLRRSAAGTQGIAARRSDAASSGATGLNITPLPTSPAATYRMTRACLRVVTRCKWT